jgi:diaminohydroxyphosphoribosylaminopyrimidine deaminase/5-amino-6-(5-phosphoribosylamino)uracil reductase
VIILTSAEALREAGDRVAALEASGATLLSSERSSLAAALRLLPDLGIQSVLLEGGAAIHRAAWEADVVDYVQLYVAPMRLGSTGIPLLDGRTLSTSELFDRREEQLGPDLLIEGYVHRPH